jgi:hypothetical protein
MNKYLLLAEHRLDDLSETVSSFLESGWILHGNTFYEASLECYYQAVVK